MLAIKISEIENEIREKRMITKKKTSLKKIRSPVWETFNEIFTADSLEAVPNFYQCTNCETIVYNPNIGGNTTRLIRHICYESKNGHDTNDHVGQERLMISAKDKEPLKSAAVKFIANDLRPYSAIEGEGLLDICVACMNFGQKFRKAGPADLKNALPSRNTVRAAVNERADEYREHVSKFLKKAIECGGIAATTDAWTDNYRHKSYLSVVCHLSIFENNEIKYHNFVLGTVEITETVKTG